MIFPGFDYFYEMMPSYKNKYYGGSLYDGQLPKGFCILPDGFFNLIRGLFVPEKPLRFFDNEPRKPMENAIIWGEAWSFIVHEKVLEIFTKNNITGWQNTYAVELYDKQGNLYHGYHGIAITGKCRKVNHHNSEVVMVKMPAYYVPHIKGIFFNESSWDGSDLFMPELNDDWPKTNQQFATKKFVDVIKKNKIMNISLTKFSDFIEDTRHFSSSQMVLPPDLKEKIAKATAALPPDARLPPEYR